MHDQFKELDTKELKFADTIFARDIETRVFQSIVIKCLHEIEGVALIEGNILDNLLGREGNDRIKGIHVDQDSKNHSVGIKIELNIAHGIPIPKKSEEIQVKITEEITNLTGLHVSVIHVIFKALISERSIDQLIDQNEEITPDALGPEEL